MFSRPFLLQSRNFEPRLRPVGNSAQQIEAQVSTAEWNWALIFMFYSPEAPRGLVQINPLAHVASQSSRCGQRSAGLKSRVAT